MARTLLTIPAADAWLPAILELPARPRGMVVFVHGRGSNRLSPRHQPVAAELARTSLASLRFDLISCAADGSPAGADPSLQACCQRLLAVLAWLSRQPGLVTLQPVGLFGASSGAAIALLAAAQRPQAIAAVVSRGGRPDLVGPDLERVQAPTLLLVGSEDARVLALNRQAALRLRCPQRLVVVPGAGHLFEQPGCLETVARLARSWFLSFLPDATAAAGVPVHRRPRNTAD